MKKTILKFILSSSLVVSSTLAIAGDNSCKDVPDHTALKDALISARNSNNGGFNLDMWGTVVNRDGIVCAVAFTGNDRGDQWPGSRVISAQKANTANAFSLPGFALSTANLYTAVQPGGSLFGLQESNPVDTEAAYKGPSKNYGQPNDPLVGKKIGGVNVFGGGLALYITDPDDDTKKKIVGAIGVSGDSSCADHEIAWRTRNGLHLDHVPAGVANLPGIVGADTSRPDNILYDILPQAGQMSGESISGWGHPECFNTAKSLLPAVP